LLLWLFRRGKVSHALESPLIVVVVVLPLAEIADAARAQLGRPGLLRLDDRVVWADRKSTVVPRLRSSAVVTSSSTQTLLIEFSDRTSTTFSLMRIAVSISSMNLSPMRKSCRSSLQRKKNATSGCARHGTRPRHCSDHCLMMP
jgi:hypothetical protein